MSELRGSLSGQTERLKDIFEQIVAENLPNLEKETSICVLEAEKTPPKVKENRKLTNLRTKDAIQGQLRGRESLHTA